MTCHNNLTVIFVGINRQVRAKCTNHIVAQELDSLLAQLNAK